MHVKCLKREENQATGEGERILPDRPDWAAERRSDRNSFQRVAQSTWLDSAVSFALARSHQWACRWHLATYLPDGVQQPRRTPNVAELCFGVMAGVAATMATDFAPPDGYKRPRVAVRTPPGEDVAIGSLHNGKDMAGTLVCHSDATPGRLARRSWERRLVLKPVV